jgi:hypothetical protein
LQRAVEEARRNADLVRWMREHGADVEAVLAKGEMDWAAAAAHFDRAGLRVDGRRPTAETAEAAWRAARRR